ncbi:MAG: TonB family protein [Paludibacteraceae bacterium]|nr:TonB family protein [Paludibacteraceae bacterium]
MLENIQGTVIVTFVVEKDGSITDIKVTRPVNHLLDEEAVRLVKTMPKWTEGMHTHCGARKPMLLIHLPYYYNDAHPLSLHLSQVSSSAPTTKNLFFNLFPNYN